MMNDVISRCEKLVLTDMSDGMLKIAKGNLGNKANVEYQIADIQIYEVDTTDWKKKMFKAHKMGYPASSGTGC